MPAHRLPWFKLYAEALEHPKITMLSDAEGWTWIHVLGKASRQSKRWYFASVEHCAKVTGRPRAHIKRLIGVALLDETPGGLMVHDWKQWQDKHPSDFQHLAPSDDEGTPPEASANSPASLPDQPVKAPASLPLDREGDPDRDPDGRSKKSESAPRLSRAFDRTTAEAYARAKGFRGNVGAEIDAFTAYYDANGWVQGKGGSPIKDRNAAWRGWIGRELKRNPPEPDQQEKHLLRRVWQAKDDIWQGGYDGGENVGQIPAQLRTALEKAEAELAEYIRNRDGDKEA